jgi:hypothetical protein
MDDAECKFNLKEICDKYHLFLNGKYKAMPNSAKDFFLRNNLLLINSDHFCVCGDSMAIR